MAENLASLVTRLETVTAKLESLASRGGGAGGGGSAAADGKCGTAVSNRRGRGLRPFFTCMSSPFPITISI